VDILDGINIFNLLMSKADVNEPHPIHRRPECSNKADTPPPTLQVREETLVWWHSNWDIWFFPVSSQTETSVFLGLKPALLILRPSDSDWNKPMNSPGSPACQLTCGFWDLPASIITWAFLISVCLSQYQPIDHLLSICLSTHILLVLFLWRTLTITQMVQRRALYHVKRRGA
jgi:hypothetical protein